jgi:hypothetical protein
MRFLSSKFETFLKICLVILILAAVFIFGRGIRNQFVSDDWVFIYGVSKIPNLAGLSKFITFDTGWFVRPTQWILTWVVFQFAGVNPAPYHFVSISLDLINAMLLGIFVYQLHRRYGQATNKYSQVLALFTLVLFFFNWRHHEAIFWYSSVNELISALFRLLTLLATLYCINKPIKNFLPGIVVALIFYSLALFSKESSVVLFLEIILILVIDFIVARHTLKRIFFYIGYLLPFLGIGVLWGYFYLHGFNGSSILNVEHGGYTILQHIPVQDYFLRFVQFFNKNFFGTDFINESVKNLWFELFFLFILFTLAFFRKRYLWLFAFIWVIIAIAPYAGTMPIGFDGNQQSVLTALLNGSDRFFYYSAASAGLLIILSVQWVIHELQLIIALKKARFLCQMVTLLLLIYPIINMSKIVQLEINWGEAGQISNNIIREIKNLVPNPREGEILCIGDLPDTYNQVYVFRNGITEALYLAYSKSTFGIRASVHLWYSPPSSTQLDLTGCTYKFIYNGYSVVPIEEKQEMSHGIRKSDIVLYRSGSWFKFDVNSGKNIGSIWTESLVGNCSPELMDYDGDGLLEYSQLCGGVWYFYNKDGSYNKEIWVGDVSGQRPVPGDYNGDGKDEVVVFRAGSWLFYDFNSGAYTGGVWTGAPVYNGTAIPLPMDVDGDGRIELTIFSAGYWSFYDKQGTFIKTINTGDSEGIPVPGDYDGAGRDEIVVFSEGAWKFFDWKTGSYLSGKSIWTGLPEYFLAGGKSIPVPLDYDGDGKLDFTIFSGGPWHFFNKDGTYYKGIWTNVLAGDIPISIRSLP